MTDQELRNEISMLGSLLGDVTRQIHGQDAFDLIENVRSLSRDARAGDQDASKRLQETICRLNLDEMRLVIRCFSVFLDLANLAEDRERIRVLQDRTRKVHPNPRSESIRYAIRSLKEAGEDAESIQQLIDRIDVELVLTAHPTEAKRRSLRSKLRNICEILYVLDQDNPLHDRRKIEAGLRSELVKLWQTDFIRPWRPSVLQEVQRGLAFAPILWEVVPRLFDDLRRALVEFYPDTSFHVSPFLRYGSWIGGDRDGHPYVTADISRQTLIWLRETALDFHLRTCEKLSESLSISQSQAVVSDGLLSFIQTARSSWPELQDRMDTIPPNEAYRRYLHVIHWRLLRTKQVRLDQGLPIGAYRSARELNEDVQLMVASLRGARATEISEAEVEPWSDRIATFGFHFAQLDVRQDSSVHTEVLTELFRAADIVDNFRDLTEVDRQRVLIETMGQSLVWSESDLSEETRETLSLFRLLRRVGRQFGMEAIGGHVVSMTRAPSDMLSVLWMWQWSAHVDGGSELDSALRLPIIPLFETIDDLQQSAKTTDALLSVPEYQNHVDGLGNRQTIMVGYSDSAKDGGYLAACWALYQAQREMYEVATKHRVGLTFFHGRGGSLGRGGGPAGRAIHSLPSRTFDGSLRLTEQGEVLAERYDDPRIASRHLEQLACSALLAAASKKDNIESEWLEVMQQLATRSRMAYRTLVEHEGLVEFFRSVTPVNEIERLPIGSRPSRRKGGHGLKDLRAIPWVFSWTQVRGLIPAWFGIGTAVDDLIEHSGDTLEQLRQMYRRWPFMQAWIGNASVALSKTDLDVFRQYAKLANDEEMLQRIAQQIESECKATKQALCLITEREELLGNVSWLAESIRVRNRYVDPLNLIQVELLRRSQGLAADDSKLEDLRHLVKLSIKGVAAGMRSTG